MATVVGIACVAYILATALHEHLGHAVACVALGGRLRELNAFYVDCDYQQMPDLSIRSVALAGPALSLLTGIVGLALFRQLRSGSASLRVFLWLVSSIAFMTAAGYLLFSGISGYGDFGVSRDGALYALAPEWLWRGLAVLLGIGAYALVVRGSVGAMEQIIGGDGRARVARAQRLSLTAYLTGGVVSVGIGLLNPLGIVIVLLSAGAASLGGTSALAWEMQWMDRQRQSAQPPLHLARSWAWIAVGLIVTVAYGALLGPSLKF